MTSNTTGRINNLLEAAEEYRIKKAYAGIGSRSTPQDVLDLMTSIATRLGSIGHTTSKTGGTGQAIRIAKAYDVPIFNLQRDDHRAAWEEVIR